jgi:glyoxylase-like metal-dependent hydrolase (beta-lactamase superfamily II)
MEGFSGIKMGKQVALTGVLRKENAARSFDRRPMLKFKSFTGGPFATNCFLVEAPGGQILFDAPEGADARFAGEKIDLLVLTHGHWDHVADAAAVKARHGCPVVCHRDTVPMVEEEDFFERRGFPLRVAPVKTDRLVAEGPGQDFLGWKLDVFEVPGHCDGSLCFHAPTDGLLIGGDVLFCGGIGRWDLPGGDGELLVRGIRQKLLPLPDATAVWPGHGSSTTIGAEKVSNPFLQS